MKTSPVTVALIAALAAAGCNDDASSAAAAPVTAEKVSAVGSQPALAAVAADFNGDGKTDLAVLNAAPSGSASFGSVSIFYGPVTNLGAPLANEVHPVPPTGRDVTAGDWNGDGAVDFAVALQGDLPTGYPGGVYFAFRTDAGAVAAHGSALDGYDARRVQSADFNGDHRADLAVTGGSNTKVILGRGNGMFAFGGTLDSTLSTAGDFNKDGRADLAAVYPGDARRIDLFRWNEGHNEPEPAGSVTITEPATALAAADMTQDGRADLLVGTAASVYVLNATSSSTFALRYRGASAPVQFLAAGDFDHASGEDFAVVEGNPANAAVSILAAGGSYAAGCSHALLTGATDLDAADLDGDGKAELVVCGSTADIYFPVHCTD